MMDFMRTATTSSFDDEGLGTLRTVVFRLADESFGVDEKRVVKILPAEALEPGMRVLPDGRFGDLRPEGAKILVLDRGGESVGMVVDAVTGVVSLDEDDVRHGEVAMFGDRACVTRVTVRQRAIGLIDVDRALAA